uniref:Uncharacterized protein n=1 Tax=Streptomyces sp. W75 TaxID=1170711 RepID=I0CEE2_9ACTN|nr:hypothetical protein pCQ4.30 [Streptomyces sp. W75]
MTCGRSPWVKGRVITGGRTGRMVVFVRFSARRREAFPMD